MRLSRGDVLQTYEVLELLGSGGMGEVYRARDSKLKREVALKFLPLEFANDAERIARFRREAEVLALLNHPHIGTIYDFENFDGLQFLVLELVDGETLADRIKRGRIPIEQTLSIAMQIAEALDAAHEKGIIHRDLKPANIKIALNERVKVLDFGLARPWEANQLANLSNAPTMTSESMAGMIVGTPAYMSPEQAKGLATDRTSDVWAFGCVLYEMLTGRQPFEGQSTTEVLAEVVKSDPDWKRLPSQTPASIRRLLRRCLQKEPKNRLQCIGDARLEIADARDVSDSEMVGSTSRTSRRERFAWIAAALATLVLLGVSAWALRMRTHSVEMSLDIATPEGSDLTSLAISPDGLNIVFVAGSSKSSLWLRSLQSAEAKPLKGTESAAFPFWSANSRSIGFFADGKLKRFDIDTGLVTPIADASGRGGAWNSNDVIVYAPGSNTALYKITANGGKPAAVTHLKGPQGTHRQPHFLPDGFHFLFWGQDGGIETRAVYVGDLDGTEPRRILDSDFSAVYSSTGDMLFFRDGRVFAQPFDAASLTLRGSPTPVADNVLFTSGLNVSALSASTTGTIAYRTGTPSERQFIWFNHDGKEIQRIGEPDKYSPTGASLSRDALRLAVERTVNGNIDIWLLDVARGVFSKFTSDASRQRSPQWSPDGSRIAYVSNPKGTYDLYVKSADGYGSEQLLLMTSESKVISDWSTNGRFLLYKSQDPKNGADLRALDVNVAEKVIPVAQTEFNEGNGQFSPDGNWVAYESNESGRFEIYVQPFPGPGRKIQVSVKGGAQVRWRRDGRALFYIALDDRLMKVPLRFDAGGHINVDSAVALFTTHVGGASQFTELQQYAVSADGEKFLMNVVTRETAISPITVVLNWRRK